MRNRNRELADVFLALRLLQRRPLRSSGDSWSSRQPVQTCPRTAREIRAPSARMTILSHLSCCEKALRGSGHFATRLNNCQE